MKYFIYILLFYIKICISFGQTNNYCDLTQQCNNCQICGEDTQNYCSCNLYNVYCYNEVPDNLTILSDFLLKYDGCLSSNGNMEKICGASNIYMDEQNNKTIINFESSYSTNFFCYYNIKKNNSNINNGNNNINILIKKEGNEDIYFNLHLVIYYNNGQIKVTSKTNILGSSNDLTIIELNVEKISVYVDINEGINMNKISMIVSMEENIIKTIKYYTDSDKKTKGLICAIIIGIITLMIIIVIIYLIRRYKNKKIKSDNSMSGVSINRKESYSILIKSHKKKINNLFKTELIPKIYFKKDNINDNFKCTICLEEFKEGLSEILTTKCNHTFHLICFKDWVYKNIMFPKCPNCNEPILKNENKNKINNISNINEIDNYNE